MSYISSATTVAYIDVRTTSKTVYLPPTFNIVGKLVTVKDIFGASSSNIITLNTSGGDVFENGTTSYTLNQSYSAAGFVAQRGVWYLLNTTGVGSSQLTDAIVGLSTLSSIVSYGLSSIVVPEVSSLSSIVSYGLSSIRNQNLALSSVISYGLSTVASGAINPGLSSLSSITSYGLSSVRADPGISSLSTIVGYGLSSVASYPGDGISSLSSLISYGLSSLIPGPDTGLSSLSSIVSYGLSSLITAQGISSISSVVSYGLSSLRTDVGVSSLSSLVSYGLSSLRTDPGISSLSSLVSYGLSSIAAQPNPGISSLSSLVSYGLSSIASQPNPGISSLSSLVSYGLSSIASQPNPGISSLSSIVSYGLSSIQVNFQSISTLSSLLSYGLSSVYADSGLSSFSTSIGSTFRTNTLYVFSNVGVRCNLPAYALDVNGSIQGKLASNSLGNFSASNLGGAGIIDAKANAPDTYVDSIYKLDYWIFQNIVSKPPAPTSVAATSTKSNISISWSNPVLYSIGLLNTFVPNITTLFVNISNAGNTVNQTLVLSNQSNLPMYPFAVQGADFMNVGTFNSNIISKSNTYYIRQTNTNITFPNGPYNLTVYFSNFNVTQQIPINFVTISGVNLLTVGTPSAPSNINITGSTATSITFSWAPPAFSDSTDGTNTIAFSNYRIVSSNTTLAGGGYPRRFGGGYDTNPPASNTVNFTGGTQTFVVTGLFPDNPYSGRIAARNVINTDYGTFSNYFTSFKTALPAEPTRLATAGNLSNFITPSPGTYTFPLQGIRAATATRINTPLTVYNLANIITQGGLKFQFTGLAIHSAQTPGVSNVDISRIIGSNDTGSTAFLSNAGFLDTSSYSVTQNNITITRNNVLDFYGVTAGYTGFYQVADYIIGFGSNLLPPSQVAYPLYVSQSNSNSPTPFFNTQTASLYVDNLTTTVSVNLLSNFGIQPVPTTYITGVVSYTSGAILSNYIDFNNIGCNFLVNPSFGQYSLTVGVNGTAISAVANLDSTNAGTTPIYDTTNTLYSSGTLPNPARVRAFTTLSDGTNAAFTSATADLVMRIRGSNINNAPVNVTCNVFYYDPTLGALKLYLDFPSIAVLAVGGVGTSNGIRVRSGTETVNPTAYGSTFDHTSNLATGGYSNELQLSKGAYATKAASADAYRNYSGYYGNNAVNYSGIASDSTIRFVTFKYTANRGGAATGTIAVRIDYTGGISFPISSGLFTGGILFQYKVNSYKDDGGNPISSPNSNPTSANQTTVWLNGNAALPVSGFDFNSWNTPDYPGLNTTSYTNTVTDRYLTIRQGNYSNLDLYIRVGIPMNAAYAFRRVSIFNYF